MEKDIEIRFDKIDDNFVTVKEKMQNHMNDDHHVIVERFNSIDTAINTLKSQLNGKNVGYAAVATPIIIFVLTLLTALI